MYESVNEVVCPKYSLIEFMDLNWSGFREHVVHLYIGFGTLGAILHGTIGIKNEATNVAAEAIPEYINFFFNCMF